MAIDKNFTFDKADFFSFIIIIACVFLSYSVVLFSNYGVHDDYHFLYNAIMGNSSTLDLLASVGRPINGILLYFGFSAAKTINNLSYLRLVTLVGISLLGCITYLVSKYNNLSTITSTLISVSVVLLPSFQLYSAWAQHFTTPFAGAIALWSSYIVTKADLSNFRSMIKSSAISASLLFVALLIYQPVAMLFCTGIIISILSAKELLKKWNFKRITAAVSVSFLALLFDFIALKIGHLHYPAQGLRYSVVSDVFGKMLWFLKEPLVSSLSFYCVPGNATIAITVCIVMVVGYAFYILRNGFRIGLYAAILLIGCIIGSYLPSLLTAENWASYRTIVALSSSFVAIFICLIVEPLVKKYNTTTVRTPSTHVEFIYAGIAIYILMISIATQKNVYDSLVLPNVIEINNLASKLETVKDKKIATIVIKPSSWQDSAAIPMAYDEFGLPSSSPTYAKVMVDIVRRSLSACSAKTDILLDNNEKITFSPDDGIFIDFRQLVTANRFHSVSACLMQNDGCMMQSANITDTNWTKGIWTNSKIPNLYSVVLLRDTGSLSIHVGDTLVFKKSGKRKVVKIDQSGNFVDILVSGTPLNASDGYPAPITLSPYD